MSLEQQLSFIKEIDRLKSVIRVNLLSDGSREENSAEHSWHLALMTVILAEHRRNLHENFSVMRAVTMALIHDIVEIDAGDTYCYNEQGHHDKYSREQEAANRLFGMLPEEQRDEYLQLWLEFEEGRSEEARFVRAVDRLNPFMQNFFSGGRKWQENNINHSQVLGRMGEIKDNVPALWPYVEWLINESVERGWVRRD